MIWRDENLNNTHILVNPILVITGSHCPSFFYLVLSLSSFRFPVILLPMVDMLFLANKMTQLSLKEFPSISSQLDKLDDE